MSDPLGWLGKALGVARLAAIRVRYRMGARGTRQTLLSVLGIALAVTLVLSVTSVSLGLATQGTVTTGETDYWIVPAESQGSAVTGVEGTRFGRVHAVTTRLERQPNIRHVTPVLFDLIQVTPVGGEPTRVFVLGVIPGTRNGTVLGLPTGALTPGDPYYANGGYNGTWTGEAVLSRSAATALNASAGTQLQTNGDRQLRVVATSPAQAPGIAQFPVVVVHLSEAQRLSGAVKQDKADQILVDATAGGVRPRLEGVYPNSDVVSRSGLLARNLRTSDLPFAMSIAAGLVAIVAGTLTIVTTMGFEVADDATTRAVLGALGISTATRVGLICLETLATTLIGGLVGIGGWLLAVGVINTVGATVASIPVAIIRPELPVYGLCLAVGVGFISLPFILVTTRRDSLLEALPE